MESEQNPTTIHLVSSTDSPEFNHLTRALTNSSVIGLDAEWKPIRTHQSTFPTVSLLQIACHIAGADDSSIESPVFLIDLASIHLPSIYQFIRDAFVSPFILKLGFRFKQDLVYLSSTFCSHGCEPGFDRVEPFLDITSIYNNLQPRQPGRRLSNQIKSLATICREVLGISLSKELQCSDWSQRPLTEEQMQYAAADAHCLIHIFEVFKVKVAKEGNSVQSITGLQIRLDLGLKQRLDTHQNSNKMCSIKFGEASKMVQAIAPDFCKRVPISEEVVTALSPDQANQMDNVLSPIVQKYGDKILLTESDRKPKISRKKERKSSGRIANKQRPTEGDGEWQGPPPWDVTSGGDGSPKFLCDVMVEGLAKHLRCVGIDAAVSYSKKPQSRDLIEQACKEKRVLLTRDAKLLRHDYLLKNQIYRVKSLLKNDQLVEIIETFQLEISEDQLMSRCTKCNGKFIQKPLTTEEAVEAAKGFQVIPNCLFNKNLEFWQCMDCKQLYWEGTQYHNAVQKFVDVCKLNE
ncbi:uncharacterized protein LOC107784932 [Nicotiana tabacum]|uniref:Uncharacterized protein LOC107784932 n=1 Tax=Nicotiana tabacum TaxID=4097 RepID=A0A1S3ZAX8_TOBAC|nr:uncharacterized protein LOC104102105 [Nicotiana tomentosiformis]XP_016461615.1 PREDICTED: uncharacterized protein LOC107784932 [Nicotiana tabacum]